MDRREGGTVMLVKNNIKYKLIEVKYTAGNKLEACAVSINLNQKLITIISIYKPPDYMLLTAEWERFFKQFSEKILIGEDFNAHHSRWGNPHSDLTGTRLVDAIDNLNLHCINNGDLNRFGNGQTCDSVIDLTISNNASLLATRWEVIRETWESDHLPIKMEIMGSVKNKFRFNMTENMRIYSIKTDWEAVVFNLYSWIPECTELRDDADIDCRMRYTSLIATVEDCVRMGTPKRKENTSNKFRTSHIRASTW